MKTPGLFGLAWFTALVAPAQASYNGLRVRVGAQSKAGSEQSESSLSSSRKNSTIHNVVASEWTRANGVYCSDNWDLEHAIKAKDHKSTDLEECKRNCKGDATCIGVSVTNENWGDRKPWCHLCHEVTTKSYHTFDTYWGAGAVDKFAVATKEAGQKEHDVQKQLREIEDIEYTMCNAPEKVEASQLVKIQGKTDLKKKLKEHKKTMHKNEDYHSESLDASIKQKEDKIAELEEKIDETKHSDRGSGGSSKEKLLNAYHASLKEAQKSLESMKEERTKHTVEGPRELLEEEERYLEADIDRITYLEKQLAKEKEQKMKLLDKVKAQMGELDDKQEQHFWEEWLAMD